jgi:hypothetical protein
LPQAQDVAEIKNEISFLNLLNGLYLSQDQYDRLIPLAEQAAAIHQKYTEEFSLAADPYIADLSKLRDSLYKTLGPSEEIKTRAVSGDAKLQKHPREQMLEDLGKIEDQARMVFSDAQLTVIRDFKACLIPPKNLRDPAAVGQVSSTEKEESLLDVIRRMPESLYQKRKTPIAEAVIKCEEREKGQMPDDVRAKMTEAYIAKMDNVRALGSVDFNLKKKQHAENFVMFDEDVKYQKGLYRELGNINKYFLNRNGADALKKYRDARSMDMAETSPEAAQTALSSKNNPGKDIALEKDQTLKKYQQQAVQLLRERQKKGLVPQQQALKIDRTIKASEQKKDAFQRFQALEKVVDQLNAMDLTRASAESMFTKIRFLALLKNTPLPQGVRGTETRPAPLMDPTGLGGAIDSARETLKKGDLPKAYASLQGISDEIRQFRD